MWYPFVKQEQSDDCGYACLAMLIEYYHHEKISISDIKLQINFSYGALSVYHLSKIANEYKINLIAYQVEKNEFLTLEIKKPLIAYIKNKMDYFHYVVIYQRRKNYLLIGDPNNENNKWIKINDFLTCFQGIVIFTKKIEALQQKGKSFWLIFNFLKESKSFLFLFVFLAIIVNFLILLGKSFIKVYLEGLLTIIENEVLFFFILFLIFYLFRIILNYCLQIITIKFQKKMTKKILTIFISNFKTVSIYEFERYSISEWLKRQEDVILLANFLGSTFPQLILTFLMMIISFLFLLNISTIILMIVILENFCLLICSLIFVQVNKIWYYKWYQKALEYENATLELYNSLRFQKSRNLEQYFNYHWTKKLNNFLNENYHCDKNQIVQKSILNLISQLAFFIIFYLALTLITKQTISIGNLMFYGIIASYINDFTMLLVSLLADKGKLEKAYHQTSFILFSNMKPSSSIMLNESINKITLTKLKYQINDILVLNNLNIEFNGHSFLKGKSGCGKTTLLEIIMQLRLVTGGEVNVNDQYNLIAVDQEIIMAKIMMLHQDDYLFSGTVYDNIVNFNQKNNYNILSLLEVKNILSRNNLVTDLEQKIINNGENLSKGQRQIILFLNLLSQQRDVYLLDEILSNVDQETKRILLTLLFKIKKNQLIIYAGHDELVESFFSNIINLEKESYYEL